MWYSPSTTGFYDDPANYNPFPSDAVEITDELYAEVMSNRPPEKIIVTGPNGLPMLADPAPPTAAELAAQAVSQRDGLMAYATTKIAPLQDAVDIEEATAAEIALLKKWKKYRVDLSRIETQAGFPADIIWPVEPV